MKPLQILTFATLPLALAACSEGGSRKTGEVTLSAEHYAVGFGGAFQLRNWPLTANDIGDDFLTLELLENGNYVVRRTGQPTSSELPYFLQSDGSLGLRISSSGSSSVTWDGAYATSNPSQEHFFVRRDARPSLFAGVKKLEGEPQLEGSWYAFGTELHFGDENQDASSDTIGRAFAGEITFDASKNLQNSNWTDSSTESGRLVLVTGTAKTFTDGEVQLTTALTGGAASGARSFEGSVAKHFGALVSRSSSEPAQTLLFLVRKHTAAWTLADLAGEWHIATQTIFVEPSQDSNGNLTRAGMDAALGRMTIEEDGDVRITVRGISNRDFSYSGTVRLGSDGQFEIEILGQSRRWIAAMDPDSKVIVFSDNVTRASVQSLDWEIGVFFAVPVQVAGN